MKKFLTTYMLQFVLVIFFCACFQKNIYAQQNNWLIGEWKSGSPLEKKSLKKNPSVVLNIYSISSNYFDGLLKIVFGRDSAYHADVKVKGNIFDKYFTAELGETVYKKLPPGNAWNSKCTKCGPVVFRFSIEDEAFVLTGITSGCNKDCDGISTYYRSMNEFDSAAQSSLAILAGLQTEVVKNEEQKTNLQQLNTQVAAIEKRKTVPQISSITFSEMKQRQVIPLPAIEIKKPEEQRTNLRQVNTQVATIEKRKTAPQIKSMAFSEMKQHKGIELPAIEIKKPGEQRTKLRQLNTQVAAIEKRKAPAQINSITFSEMKKHKGIQLPAIEIKKPEEERTKLLQLDMQVAAIKKRKVASQKKDMVSVVMKKKTGVMLAAVNTKKPIAEKKDLAKQEAAAQQKIKDSIALAEKKITAAQTVTINNSKDNKEKSATVKPAANTGLQKNQTVAVEQSKPDEKKKDSISAVVKKIIDTSATVKIAPLPLPEKKPEVFEKRNTNLITAYNVDEDSITLRLFDNGIIDGDTVSVFYNDSVVVQRLGLSSRAFQLKLAVNKTADDKVVLYAHNLGSIAPNSALLEIFTKQKHYQLTVSSDLQNSSGIVLRYKKE